MPAGTLRLTVPITIEHPVAGPIGPGVYVSGISDFIGPLPSGSHWVIEVRNQADGIAAMQVSTPAPDAVAFQVQLGSRVAPQFSTIGNEQIVPGAQSNVVVQLLDDTGRVLDSGTRQFQWQPSSSDWALLHTLTAGGQGGFTQADRELLVDVQAAQRVEYTVPAPVPTDLSLPFGSMTWNGALGLLNRAESLIITGRGSAHRGSSSNQLDAYGARIFLLDWPPGYGHTPGAIELFERRMVQLVVVRRTADGSEWASDVWDIRQSGAIYRWDYPLPLRLEYLVAPGVTAELQWYTLPGQ